MKIDGETEILPSVQDDIDYVEENFREGDRLEHESLGGGRTLLSMFEECWTVRHKGEIIGYCGIGVPGGETFLSPERYLCYMSCMNAEKHKIAYVKLSRAVMKAIVAETPNYVDYFKSLPNEAYRGSVIWHERVLKMKRLREIEYKGERFVLFGISREEALK